MLNSYSHPRKSFWILQATFAWINALAVLAKEELLMKQEVQASWN